MAKPICRVVHVPQWFHSRSDFVIYAARLNTCHSRLFGLRSFEGAQSVGRFAYHPTTMELKDAPYKFDNCLLYLIIWINSSMI